MTIPGGNVEQKVQAPAIALLVVGALNVLLGLYNIFSGLFSTATSAAAGADANLTKDQQQLLATIQALSGTTAIVWGIIVLAIAAVIIVAAFKMKKLESFALVMAGNILAMIPCISCCLAGLPVGIWSLVVLNDPEVKAAFR